MQKTASPPLGNAEIINGEVTLCGLLLVQAIAMR